MSPVPAQLNQPTAASVHTEPGPPSTKGNLNPETLLSLLVMSLVLLLLAALGVAGWQLWRRNQHRRLPTPALPPPPPDPFSAQQITQTFIAALPTLTRELNLEVATTTQTEFFERRDQKSTLWGLLDLGTNTAQIRVPVTYRYHLRLAEPWRLEAKNGHLIVHAPAVRPSLPPALHTDKMDLQTVRGWAREHPAELVRQLQHELTPTLCRWAEDEQHLALVRESARTSVAEFVGRWLEGEGRWRPGGYSAITVRLGGESLPPPQPTRSLFLRS